MDTMMRKDDIGSMTVCMFPLCCYSNQSYWGFITLPVGFSRENLSIPRSIVWWLCPDSLNGARQTVHVQIQWVSVQCVDLATKTWNCGLSFFQTLFQWQHMWLLQSTLLLHTPIQRWQHHQQHQHWSATMWQPAEATFKELLCFDQLMLQPITS